MLGDGYPSEITLYILRSNCTKFGAFVRSVPILLLSDLTIGTFMQYHIINHNIL